MNERIKDLLLKSGFTNAYSDPREGFELAFVDEDHALESVTKFAALLVEECARVARATPCPSFPEDSKQQLGHAWDMAAAEAGRSIARHFGGSQ